MIHCLRYESGEKTQVSAVVKYDEGKHDSPSIVGSYSSTKWLWINWIVKADFPTPMRAGLRCEQKIGGEWRLTSSSNDDKLVLPQELCLLECE